MFLVQRIYSISDKPFLSRARATLPEAYLVINKQKDGAIVAMCVRSCFFFYCLQLFFAEYGVFARKFIPKRTQFGPLEGKLVQTDTIKTEDNTLLFYLSIDGVVTALDTSDESKMKQMN